MLYKYILISLTFSTLGLEHFSNAGLTDPITLLFPDPCNQTAVPKFDEAKYSGTWYTVYLTVDSTPYHPRYVREEIQNTLLGMKMKRFSLVYTDIQLQQLDLVPYGFTKGKYYLHGDGLKDSSGYVVVKTNYDEFSLEVFCYRYKDGSEFASASVNSRVKEYDIDRVQEYISAMWDLGFYPGLPVKQL